MPFSPRNIISEKIAKMGLEEGRSAELQGLKKTDPTSLKAAIRQRRQERAVESKRKGQTSFQLSALACGLKSELKGQVIKV